MQALAAGRLAKSRSARTPPAAAQRDGRPSINPTKRHVGRPDPEVEHQSARTVRIAGLGNSTDASSTAPS